MKKFEKVVILCGGRSREHDVSIHSAAAVFEVLKTIYPTQLLTLQENDLPSELNPETDFIFPLIHGDFGEDGQLQTLLEAWHFAYLGSKPCASALCMHKMHTKRLAQAHHIPVLPGMLLQPRQTLNQATLEQNLQATTFVLKPENQGSSIGVHLCSDFEHLQSAWADITDGLWMIEPYIKGKELAIGVLQGKALGIVEICPKQGFYDYHNKYTPGACDYKAPAALAPSITQHIQNIAEQLFQTVQCQDLARIDFILADDGSAWPLEINTIPGMTEQSLFPKSAACVGIAIKELLIRLIEGACKRF